MRTLHNKKNHFVRFSTPAAESIPNLTVWATRTVAKHGDKPEIHDGIVTAWKSIVSMDEDGSRGAGMWTVEIPGIGLTGFMMENVFAGADDDEVYAAIGTPADDEFRRYFMDFILRSGASVRDIVDDDELWPFVFDMDRDFVRADRDERLRSANDADADDGSADDSSGADEEVTLTQGTFLSDLFNGDEKPESVYVIAYDPDGEGDYNRLEENLDALGALRIFRNVWCKKDSGDVEDVRLFVEKRCCGGQDLRFIVTLATAWANNGAELTPADLVE